MSNELTAARSTGILTPQNVDEALKVCDYLSKSNIVPKDFQGNPGNILVAIQWGMELGLPPMQAMQSIAVINGRPSLWGDAVLALCKASPICEYVIETFEGEGDAMVAICTTKRKGDPDVTARSFSTADARRAGLFGKAGVWTQYPRRMLQLRARAFCLRDAYPDLLRGIAVTEEVQDTPPAMKTIAHKPPPAIVAEPTPDISALLAALHDAQSREALETYRAAVAALPRPEKKQAIDAWKAAETRIASEKVIEVVAE